MKEKPILFSADMIRAILDGRKTQTRRVIKLPPSSSYLGIIEERQTYWFGTPENPKGVASMEKRCPYGARGDQLWVRETAYISPPNFCKRYEATHIDPDGAPRVVDYAASMDADAVRAAEDYGIKKTPSIFMPRWASRTQLKVKSIGVDRLQNISEDDAHAEGIPRRKGPYILDFAKLWDEINGKRGYSWRSDPLVWVVKFEREGE